ncbi:MAG: sigma-54 dependent transcriptional regulator, partial [Candidatus Methylomirabilis sp.]|nr:sigma-54 dependent transcriptional regulator [Deltaproteobacteria bacterium]
MSKLILIVDDEADIRGAIGGALRDEGYRVAEARGGQQALDRVAEGPPPDAVLLDIWMKGIDGVETLSRLRERRPEIPVIMITGHGNVETAVRCLKLGAFDFLEKPLSLDKVLLTIQKALEHAELLVENEALRGALAEQTSTELIGESEPIRLLREQIARAAPSDTAILIGGESGAGKEVIARMIHRLSKRADKPFIELNCAAIPETLIEAELFGSEKGAFTGAVQKSGKFALADGGTLFL